MHDHALGGSWSASGIPSNKSQVVYIYDAKDRLTQAANSTWTASTNYAYDFGDNRTSRIQGTNSWVNNYNVASNRLDATTPWVSGVAGSSVSQSYDAMGNLINTGSKSYSYDVAGRMVAVNAGATGATYQVNANGLRVRKNVSGTGAHQELVAYNSGRQRLGSYQPNGLGGFNVNEELVYLLGSWQIAATVRGQVVSGADGTAYPILSDQIGTPRVVLDPATGDRRWTWNSKEAFGDTVPNGNPNSLPGGNFTFNARLPGQFLAAETGLLHNGYRDYNPRLGRYVQSDPIGLEAGWNTYGYVISNPITSIDPLGLEVFIPNRAMKIEYDRGKQYLSKSKTARDLIEKLEKSTMIHTVQMPEGGNFYDPYTGNLGWNPNYGLIGYPTWLCGPGTDYWVSPAMRLLHELGHAKRTQDGKFAEGLYFMDSYRQRKREEKAVLNIEMQVARELGLRTDITPIQRYFGVRQKHR